MEHYYPLRRVPQTATGRELWVHLRELAGPLSRSIAAHARASLIPTGDERVRASRAEQARRAGEETLMRMQHIYFANPGLDTLTVRMMSKMGREVAYGAARILRTQLKLGLDKSGRATRNLKVLPQTGYDALMVTGLSAGKALGYFRGGRVVSRLWWDSADPERDPQFDEGHSRPRVRRFEAPLSLRDMAADIDDLYWASAYGQSIKVTRVGEGEARRWLVSLPGTDHSEFETQPNPADLEANLREELNMPNAMRRGAIEVIRSAMLEDGVKPEEIVNEHVFICGHSQGGMIAAALASADPKQVGINVDRILTLGSPTRRLRLREDVVAVAVEHDQDIVPSLDGTPRRNPDQRVTIQRKLNPPRWNPLFYAHASSTYTETLRRAERQSAVAPWGREAEALKALQDYLPKVGEPTRVFHSYVWQEVRDPEDLQPWADIFDVKLPEDWQPVRYDGEVEINEAVAVPVVDRIGELASHLAAVGIEKEGGHGIGSKALD
ncbi:PGAP1-like alpha/beta domain-containing protein [Actinomyces minihominis]|uniref:PGAP1-like alpha/beta domain-containing protein n=1 Tax=Actinomyces minihominis TaxID=2002838 RepID=UPI00101AEC9A|nr:alpha/beta fold hydrolase [Actinomyces minihominis]